LAKHIWSERRQSERRSDATALGDERRGKSRGPKRRNFFRLAYPSTVSPKLLNANFHVADISEYGIAFVCRDNCEKCTGPITLKSIVNLRIQFHDGETIDIRVEVLRCERTLYSQKKTYAGFVRNGISAQRIAKEQAYLLSHFADFCRAPTE